MVTPKTARLEGMQAGWCNWWLNLPPEYLVVGTIGRIVKSFP
jgi:hypothetical protein